MVTVGGWCSTLFFLRVLKISDFESQLLKVKYGETKRGYLRCYTTILEPASVK
jgi:hypothetical protein